MHRIVVSWNISKCRYSRQTIPLVSIIIDVLPDSIVRQHEHIYWQTSFEELEAFLILLQDVEMLNHPAVGITKPQFAAVVVQLDYKTANGYSISGSHLHLSHGIMGPNEPPQPKG